MLIPMTDDPRRVVAAHVRTRHALAWPLYLAALMLSFGSDLLGHFANGSSATIGCDSPARV